MTNSSERANRAVNNTDREIYRGPDKGNGSYYADSIFVAQGGEGIGIDVGGHVIVLPLRRWHQLAKDSQTPAPCDGCDGHECIEDGKYVCKYPGASAPSPQHPEAGDRASVVEECIAAAKSVGNFGDYKREELTDDYGKPRFDMMNEIIDRLRSLSTQQDKKVAG